MPPFFMPEICKWSRSTYCNFLKLFYFVSITVIHEEINFFRDLPTKYGLDKVAAAFKKFNIHGLLFIGGFEVSHPQEYQF